MIKDKYEEIKTLYCKFPPTPDNAFSNELIVVEPKEVYKILSHRENLRTGQTKVIIERVPT